MAYVARGSRFDAPTDMHTPADSAPQTTELTARCKLCGFEFQVQTENESQLTTCPFCGAGSDYHPGLTFHSERPTYGNYGGVSGYGAELSHRHTRHT